MATIRIEMKVPDDNCAYCHSAYFLSRSKILYCRQFQNKTIKEGDVYRRCKECLAATVEEK